MIYPQNITFDFAHIQEYWMFAVGILSLTTLVVGFLELEKTILTFGVTILMSLILKLYDSGTLPNIFVSYLFICSLAIIYNIFNYIKIMDVEMEKLSKVIETFGRESLYLDIIYSGDKIDAEYLLSYYKIKISDVDTEKQKHLENMNKIIVPENIKLCDKEEIFNRIGSLLTYVKTQKVMVINSIVMNGFKPSNSLIKFYLKLISMKRSMIPNINGSHEKFNLIVSKIISRFGNKFNPDELINMINFNPIPQYKQDNENFKIVLNKTIYGIEKYLDAYQKHNMYFF